MLEGLLYASVDPLKLQKGPILPRNLVRMRNRALYESETDAFGQEP